MPLTDEEKAEIKAEIAEARRILKEDAQLAHNARMEERWKRVHGDDPAPDPAPGPGGPPAPGKQDPPESKTKKSGWWGDALKDD